MRRNLGRFLLLGTVLVLAPDWTHGSPAMPEAGASSFIELSLAELVSASTLIVRGTPMDASSVWEDTEHGQRIVTYTRVRLDEIIDGRAGEKEVWIRTLGGQVGEIGQHVDGEAVLAPAQEGVMFLRRRPDGTHAVVGMAQGHFALQAAPGEKAPRLFVPRALGNVLPRPGVVPSGSLPARLVLGGRTLEEATRIILSERHNHAE